MSWQAALWPLIALALNAMLQRSGADNFPSSETLSPARTSVFICLADILVVLLWMCRGLAAKQGFRETARLYMCDMGIFSGENMLLKGTPAVGLILFVLVPVPQALKLVGSRGIPGTQTWMVIFLMAYLVSIVINVFGVPHNEKATGMKPRAILSRTERQRLVTLSDTIYSLAYLAQLGVWIWIAADLFESGFESELRTSPGHGVVRLTFYGVVFLWLGLTCYLFEKSNLVGAVLGIGWIVFLARVHRSAYIAWLLKVYHSWIGGVARFLSFVISVLVALAFIAAGVAITMAINVLFEELGHIIAGPPPVKKVRVPSTQISLPLLPEPAHLSDADRQDSSEIVEERDTTFSCVRRAKSLHFPLTESDHGERSRRPSLTLEANLQGMVGSAEEENKHLVAAVTQGHHASKRDAEKLLDRLLWQPDEHRLFRRMLSIGFALTNLVLTTLFYGYKYERAGTYRAPWTEQIG